MDYAGRAARKQRARREEPLPNPSPRGGGASDPGFSPSPSGGGVGEGFLPLDRVPPLPVSPAPIAPGPRGDADGPPCRRDAGRAPRTRPARPPQVVLAEAPAAGDYARYSVELDLTGKLIVTQEGNKETIRLEAKARHVFSERTLTVADGLPARSARHYEDAVASAVVDVEKVNRRCPTTAG